MTVSVPSATSAVTGRSVTTVAMTAVTTVQHVAIGMTADRVATGMTAHRVATATTVLHVAIATRLASASAPVPARRPANALVARAPNGHRGRSSRATSPHAEPDADSAPGRTVATATVRVYPIG